MSFFEKRANRRKVRRTVHPSPETPVHNGHNYEDEVATPPIMPQDPLYSMPVDLDEEASHPNLHGIPPHHEGRYSEDQEAVSATKSNGFSARYGKRSSESKRKHEHQASGMASPPPSGKVEHPAQDASKPHDTVSPSGGYTPPPEFRMIREEVQQFLVNEAKAVSQAGGAANVRQLIEPVFGRALEKANLIVSRTERQRMLDMILSDILGYGPIQPLLDDDTISEIMVNSPDQVFIEQNGKIQLTDVKFYDDRHVLQVIDRIVAPLGRHIDESSPMVDARLPDGSRLNAIIPPLALRGPCVTIRKFRKDPMTVQDLVNFGTFTAEFVEFMDACVKASFNIVISGGTGSGKTTTLNVLSSMIPSTERIVTIEDSAELQLQQPHVIRLESRAANVEGKGKIGIRELVINSLRMRPDRIVVGEVRSGEALDMLQAMNTGHDGSLTTVHSNGARDTLNRIETMVMMAGMDLPLKAIRQQIASAVDMVVHVDRLRDGSRRIVQCAEIMGMEGDTIVMQDIFAFEQKGLSEEGKVLGELNPTGLRPKAVQRIQEAGIELPAHIFGVNMDKVFDI
ncbi:MAG: CpaF family protein [Chloroflexota bacterium]